MRTSDHDPLGSTNQQRTSHVGSLPVTADPLLTAKEAAAYRRQGRSTFWRDVKEGRVPPPIYISPKAPRWRLSDLCPPLPDAMPAVVPPTTRTQGVKK